MFNKCTQRLGDRFFGLVPLKKAPFIIGYTRIIVSGISMLLMTILFILVATATLDDVISFLEYHEESIFNRTAHRPQDAGEKPYNVDAIDAEEAIYFASIVTGIIAFVISMNALSFIFSMTLVCGAHKRNVHLMRAYCVFGLIEIGADTTGVVFGFIFYQCGIYALCLTGIAIRCYFVITVNKAIKEVDRQSQSQTTTNGMVYVTHVDTKTPGVA